MGIHFFLGSYDENSVGRNLEANGFVKSDRFDGQYISNNGGIVITLTDSGRGTVEIQGEGVSSLKMSPKAYHNIENLAVLLNPQKITNGTCGEILQELIR